MRKFLDKTGRSFEVVAHHHFDCIMMSIEDKNTLGGKKILEISEADIDSLVVSLINSKNELVTARLAKPNLADEEDNENSTDPHPFLGADQKPPLFKEMAILEFFGNEQAGVPHMLLDVKLDFARELKAGDEINFWGDQYGDDSEFRPSFVLSPIEKLAPLIQKSFRVKKRLFDIESSSWTDENRLRIICEYSATF